MHTEGAPGWVWSPLMGVRWSTVLTWLVLFAVVSWQTRNPIKGLVLAMAWLSGYEILYQTTGSLLHRWSLQTLMFTTTGTTGWLIATYLFGFRPEWRTSAVFVALWLSWMLSGYESNMPDRIIGGTAIHWSWLDEMFNVSTKTMLALVLLAPQLKDLKVRTRHVEGRTASTDGTLKLEGIAAGSHGG